MKAAELYKKTLAGYEASLSKGDSVTLSRYCKINHVNCRGLRNWVEMLYLNTFIPTGMDPALDLRPVGCI